MQPIDWSATAAWIALAISIIGTIAGPIITTVLTNNHQLKLRKLDMEQNHLDAYKKRRYEVISAFFRDVGAYVSAGHIDDKSQAGRSFHAVYQYLRMEDWELFDEFYQKLFSLHREGASELYPQVTYCLSEILKEEPRLLP